MRFDLAVLCTALLCLPRFAHAGEAVELIHADALSSFRAVEGWHLIGRVSGGPDSKALTVEPFAPGDPAILLNSAQKDRVPYLFTQEEFQDVEVELGFMLPHESNAGIYFMGRYETQILDSYGKDQVTFSDLGGIYQRWRSQAEADRLGEKRGYEGVAPRVNAAKAPGQWQTMRVVFRAPRFDADGEKTENARFLSVHVNGQQVQEDVEVTGPTRGNPIGGEAASGPVSIQGNHGPIAIRSFKVKRLALD